MGDKAGAGARPDIGFGFSLRGKEATGGFEMGVSMI